MSQPELGNGKITDDYLIAALATAVKRCRAKRTDEGDMRQGEVAIYMDEGGCIAVQLRFRNGSATECGRWGSLREAIKATVGAP